MKKMKDNLKNASEKQENMRLNSVNSKTRKKKKKKKVTDDFNCVKYVSAENKKLSENSHFSCVYING